MAETPLPAGKTCGACTKFLACLTRGFTDDEKRSVCHFDPSRFDDLKARVEGTVATLTSPPSPPSSPGDKKAVPLAVQREESGPAGRGFIDGLRENAAPASQACDDTKQPPPGHGEGSAGVGATGMPNRQPVPGAPEAAEKADGGRPKGNKSQRRREAKAAEQAAKRRAIEEQYGIQLPKPSKPLVGGRYLRVKEASRVRYGSRVQKPGGPRG